MKEETYGFERDRDEKTMRCNCDGKHVCKGCLAREREYYNED